MSEIPVPEELQNLLAELWTEVNGPKGPDRKPIRFNLKPNQHIYNYYQGPHREMYCYTPHCDTNGNYWVWTYKPFGKGCRSGKAKRWRMVDRVRIADPRWARMAALGRWKEAKDARNGRTP